MSAARGSRGQNRFDQDHFGELLADRETRIADLADEIGLAGQQLYDVVLTKDEFAQAVLNLRRGAELFDSHGNTGFDSVQGTNLTTRLFTPA